MSTKTGYRYCLIPIFILLFGLEVAVAEANGPADPPYPCKDNLIEVMFSWDSQVRLRDGKPVDLSASKALNGVNEVLAKVTPCTWRRVGDVSEEKLDELHLRGEMNTGQAVYNLNNIYRLRIPKGNDIWSLCEELEALPGIITARPMPLPTPPPAVQPPDYQSLQGYSQPASSTPTGLDIVYAWGQPGGDGAGVTVCDIEYSWYSHNDISQLPGSQINTYPILDPFPAQRAFHGTAVAGVLAADDNGIGTTGICKNATLLTCASYFIYPGPPPDTVWDVPAAIIMASTAMSAGDVILLEHQWDYNDPGTAHPDYIPIEWWNCYYPNAQSFNGVFSTIWAAIAAGIHVVEAGGNGGAPTLNSGYNTDPLSWYPQHSGAIIVGAGGAYTGGTWAEGDLERISWSSYGTRYDLQGWGENVATTAYGDLDSTYGYYWMYTNSFDGTSSASPCVAGAVACCVGYWMAQGVPPSSLTPPMLRNYLVTSGTAQITPPFGNIGPRPNLQAAFALLKAEWTDVTAPPVDIFSQHSIGAAWGDYDNNGSLDLYVSNSNNNPNKLFRNDSPSFTDVSAPPVDNAGVGYGVAWGDYDNDGNLDLYLANSGTANKLFRNNGLGVFVDVTSSPIDDPAGSSQQVNWVDYDNDGDIDLYVTTYAGPNKLFRNDGGGSWTDIISTPVNYSGSSAGAAWADYDNDGDMDLYLACNYAEANHLYRNDGGGTFTDVTSPLLADIGEGTGVAWGDYDGDGDFDLYVVNNSITQPNKMFENQGGTFVDPGTTVLNDTGWGLSAGWADYDNDGDLDLYVTNSSGSNKLFRNDGPVVFSDATSPVLADTGYGMGFAWGDYDNDGDLDIYVPNAGLWQNCRMYRNEIGDDNNWLKVDLIGVASNKCGIGARIRISAGGVSQIREVTSGSGYCSMHSLTAEFGVGGKTWIDSLIIDWPSGTNQVIVGVNVNNHMLVTEPTGPIVCGDANSDGSVNVGDAVYVISYVFKGGPAPVPVCRGDANGDGSCNVGDAVYLIAYVFKGGPAPLPGCCP